MKAHRDQQAVDASLKALKEAANGEANLVPYLIDAVKTYATLGEICGVLREVSENTSREVICFKAKAGVYVAFGEYHGNS